MKKSWKTTIAGAIAAAAWGMHAAGISVGHFGSTDFVSLIAQLATGAGLLFAKDHDATGGTRVVGPTQ